MLHFIPQLTHTDIYVLLRRPIIFPMRLLKLPGAMDGGGEFLDSERKQDVGVHDKQEGNNWSELKVNSYTIKLYIAQKVFNAVYFKGGLNKCTIFPGSY